MPPAIGVGIVGLSARGGWAANAHVPALRAVDGVELRGLAASSREAADRAAARFDVPWATTDVAELAARPDIDLVVVAVPTPLHRKLIEPVLEAGKMVHSEWPLAVDAAEAADLAERAGRRGVRTVAGLQARSVPMVRYLRDLIADGYVGEVLSSTLVGSGGGWGGAVPSRLLYTLDRASGATMLTIPFGHTLAAFTMCLSGFATLTATTATRRPVARNTDTGEDVPVRTADQVAVSGVLETGAVAALHYRGGSSRATNLRWEINGTDGDLVVTGGSGHLQMGQAVLHGARGKDTALAELAVPSRYHAVPEAVAPWSGVAHSYAQLVADIREGTSVVPDFAAAAEHTQQLERIARASG
ncbi:Gfo/Idh/MocA family oxidoreductase [Actinoplanes sp. NPDC049596]|uniref:Gfo/Idh/MocA family protein n=1 Tax=unclassified Actinoplanes TaxID=2626549 RepID=UPI0034408611